MGMILGARHLGLDEPVAIKVLLPAMLEIPGMVERFLREARAATKIKNEHVVRIMDVDVLPTSGVPYMVMERLDGMDLNHVRKQRRELPIPEVVRWVLEVCEAIAEAHALGIVHRDLKPANLFLARRRDGSTCVKVLDFGISKIEPRPDATDQRVTTTGTALGSPCYMAPEQMVSTRDADARADIWSLGVILYELSTGTLPFRAETLAALCTRVLHGPPPEPPTTLRPGLPPALEATILRCLERNRARRFATVEELSAALLPFSASPPASPAREPTRAEPLQPTPPSQGAAPGKSLGDTIGGTVTPPRLRSRRGMHPLAVGALAMVLSATALLLGVRLWRSIMMEPVPATAAPEGAPLPSAIAASAAPEPPAAALSAENEPAGNATGHATKATAPASASARTTTFPRASPGGTATTSAAPPAYAPDPFGGSRK
jgi:serine/threonine-protein kinase